MVDGVRLQFMVRAAALLVLLIISPTILAAPSPGQPEVMNDICSTWESTVGICDDYDSNLDASPLDEWVTSALRVRVESAESVSLSVQLAVHELSRIDLDLTDIDLGGDSTNLDGIPADYIRNYLDFERDGQTVEQRMIDRIEDMMKEYIEENFEYAESSVVTTISEVDFHSQNNIECIYNSDADSIDEVNGMDNDPFNPPLCFEAVFELVLNPLKLGMQEGTNTDFDRMMQGLLVMGATMESTFTASAAAGHALELVIFPPEYATATHVIPPGEKYTRVFNSVQQGYGLLFLDQIEAELGVGVRSEDLTLRLNHREIETQTVSINMNVEPALTLDLFIDARDSMSTNIGLELAIHYLDESVLDEWNTEFAGGSLNLPWVTSDGIRMFKTETNEDLSNLLDGLPLTDLSEEFSNMLGTEVSFISPQFADADLNSGLDFRHQPSQTCDEQLEVQYCLDGDNAMSGKYPVIIESNSQPTQMRISQIIENMMASNMGAISTLDFSIITDEDLAAIMSVVEIEFASNPEWLQQMLPANFPATDISLTLMLPDWLKSTNGEPDKLILSAPMSGSQTENLQFEGTRQFDWRHPICIQSIPCENSSPDLICSSTQATCITSRVEIDIENIRLKETSGAIEIDFSAEIVLAIHRINFDLSQDGLATSPLPADLIRRAIVLGDRKEGGLLSGSELSVPLDIGTGEIIDLEISNAGMASLAETISQRSAALFDDNKITNFPMDFGFAEYSMDVDMVSTPFVADVEEFELPISIEPSDYIAFEVGARIDNARATITSEQDNMYLNIGSASLFSIFEETFGWPFGEPITNDFGIGFENAKMKQKIMPIMEHTQLGTIRSSALIIIHMPEDIRFISFESKTGFASLSEEDGRQVLTYLSPICPDAATWTICKKNADTITYNVEYGWTIIFTELAPYLVLLSVGLAMMMSRIIRKRKERKSAKQKLLDEKELIETETAAVAEFGEMSSPIIMVEESFFEEK
ncbi:MAG: hypothetical protein HN534_06145 [Euryarchaeota archaeon]|jgi:hypothetical protein|nr:hypothetical protein [Euryarchaeota archaeon]MBT3654491.1 hypothetical protein [Euryarchaeota archaeon]MBT3757959.1 hypothetical protein [Euryarchaeota archaeon]MBT4050817.1 hypothetical protein [Euryarchaeota archaeon]MBT4346785.1 hypothetical protein [Euryarchaeota archaeon]